VACWNARAWWSCGWRRVCAEAIEQATVLGPDVALLDIYLGGESGFDLARRLSQETNLAGIRMILIPTHAETDYTDLITASTAVRFLPIVTGLRQLESGQDAAHVFFHGALGDPQPPPDTGIDRPSAIITDTSRSREWFEVTPARPRALFTH
jgi:CheY-like chemotaxis protein